MRYPRWLTILAALTVPVLLLSLIMNLPSLSEAAEEGLMFGVLLEALILMVTILVTGLQLWKHQAAVEASVVHEKKNVAELASYRRFTLATISLSASVVLPLLTAILFSLET